MISKSGDVEKLVMWRETSESHATGHNNETMKLLKT